MAVEDLLAACSAGGEAFLRDVVDKHADRGNAFNLADLFSSVSAGEAEKIWAALLALSKSQLDIVGEAFDEDEDGGGGEDDEAAEEVRDAAADTARNVLKAVTGIARLYLKTMAAPPAGKGKARAAAATAKVPKSLTALTVALHDIILELGEVYVAAASVTPPRGCAGVNAMRVRARA